MKKALFVILICVFAAAAGCAQSENERVTETPGQGSEASGDSNGSGDADGVSGLAEADEISGGFVFEYKGEKILLGDEINDVTDRIGEARSVFESPSCAFDGIDRIYSFPGFEIYTYPEGETDIVYLIYFRDDSVATPEGIYLGLTIDEAIAAYGDGYAHEFGQYAYLINRTWLKFLTDGDKNIEAITYELDLGMRG
ncbi:MAG: hypothetical protein FWF03_03460 [Defluviitaleaceae bacterium]|nr:hypothetical protein [Defluviitaleaceae bacterium]